MSDPRPQCQCAVCQSTAAVPELFPPRSDAVPADQVEAEWPVGVERAGWQVAWTVEEQAAYEHARSNGDQGLPGIVSTEPRDTARLTGRPAGILMHDPVGSADPSTASHWRLVATALIRRLAGECTEDGGCTGGDRSGRVRLSWAELEHARELTLVEWPAYEAAAEYTAYRAPEARVA